ncbi:MAG: hypothetical protein COC15_05070 [Legionellales bacterium]|nr:MAG: hypothetical protein COC15_05070 [Legionellales bacterium]
MSNKSRIQDFFYSFFDGSCEQFDSTYDLFSDNVTIDTTLGKSIGRASIGAVNAHWMQAFPDLQGTADFIYEGNLVVANYKGWGVNEGTFMNNAATGKSMECSGIMIFEFSEDKIVSYKNTTDILGIYNQLGIQISAASLPTSRQKTHKNFEFLLQQIRNFSRNNVSLTKREAEILSFWVNGRSARDIGDFFKLSYRTVQGYVGNIMLKLDCGSRRTLLDAIIDSQALHLFREFYDLCIETNRFL